MAQDPYGLGASGIPPELAQEILGIKGKRAIAEALMKQSLEPLEAPQVKGRFTVPVSPLQGIAKLTKAYMGGKGMVEADKSMAGVGEKYQKGVSEALGQYNKTYSGTPEMPLPSDQSGPPVPATPGNPRQAVMEAMNNAYLRNNPLVQADLKKMSLKGTDDPSNVREWEFFNQLSPDQQEAFLRMKRADKFLDVGSGYVSPSPTDPTRTSPVATKGLPPQERPEHKGAVVEAEKGAAAKVAKEVQYPKARETLGSLERQWTNVEDVIDKSIKMVSPYTAGFGSWLSVVPATPQKTLAKNLETIRANIGFDKLQDMRANSPTGGALGQVSDFENRLLQAVQRSLDQGLAPSELADNLKEVKTLLQGLREQKRQAFQTDFKEISSREISTPSMPEGIDPKVWEVMTPEEKALWK